MIDMKSEELISRATAIEALEAKKEADDIKPGGSVSPDWYWGTDCGLDAAIEILAALPVVPTDSDLVSELHECLAMHHTADYDLRQDIIEILTHFPVPLVPQSDETVLEWKRDDTEGYWDAEDWCVWDSGQITHKFPRDCYYPFTFCETVDAAKSLAQRLQDVLVSRAPPVSGEGRQISKSDLDELIAADDENENRPALREESK